MRTIFRVSCAALILSLAGPAEAALLAPTAMVGGRSQNDWAEQWWSWAGNIPTASNPVVETDGSFSYLGDQGPVFFLAGVFGGGDPVNRTVTIEADQHIFFPLLNAITWDAYSLYPDDFERDLIETIGDVSSLHAELDGTPLAATTEALAGWLQQSPDDFDLDILEGGIFNEFGDAPGIRKAQQRGYWLMLEPLGLGTHTLKFGGTSTPSGGYSGVFPPNIQDITYAIRVVPEPSALALAAIGGVGLLVGLRGRRPASLAASRTA